jgi:uncharacterized protein YxjI
MKTGNFPSVLNGSAFLVKEHVGMFKASNNYDIYDPAANQLILECREKDLSIFTKLFRFSDYKRMTPFDVRIQLPGGQELIRVKRGISIFVSNVRVMDGQDNPLGSFKQKFFSLGGRFTVIDNEGNPVFTLKGKWTGWDFRFMQGDTELAHVTKKWAGLGKELFTSADNYMLTISDNVPANSDLRRLIFASVMCIDMVLKE